MVSKSESIIFNDISKDIEQYLIKPFILIFLLERAKYSTAAYYN